MRAPMACCLIGFAATGCAVTGTILVRSNAACSLKATVGSINMDEAEAIMLAGADARIIAEHAAPLIHRIAFLRSWKQQTGSLGEIGQAALNSARQELRDLLRNGPPSAPLTP